MPRVSVLMPVYNAERYVGKAIESILLQTYRDFEFLIIDDGSTDRSLSILRKYEAQDGRIRLVSRPNTGLVGALNEMVGEATGEFLARMDADDVALPRRLECQVSGMLADPGVVALGTRVLLIDPDELPICEMCSETHHEAIDEAHLAGSGMLQLCHPSVMMRREAVCRVGLYRDKFACAEDVDLFLRLAEIGRLANLPEVLLHYRMHGTSVGHARNEQQRLSVERAASEARVRRGLPPLPPRSTECNGGLGRGQCHRRWAWWALRAGHLGTARKHARLAVRAEPWSLESWKALACAVRGY